MASNYDDYDRRPRPIRSNEAFPRPRNEPHERPTPATKPPNEPGLRSGESGSAAQKMNYNTPQHRDSRHLHSSSLTVPEDATRRHPRARSRSRKRSTWPPPATCEDEAASLAKEAGSQSLLESIGKDEVTVRGAIDQEPIVQDVQKPTTKHEHYIPASRDSLRPPKTSDVPTPPTSDDEKARKANRRPSKLNMNFDDIKKGVPEFTKRTASPYAFAKDKVSSKADAPKERLLSPESYLTPLPTETRNRLKERTTSKSRPSSPARKASRADTGDDYFSLASTDSAIDDTDYASDSSSKAGRRKPSTYPPSRADVPKQSEVVDFAPQPSAMSNRRMNLDARRNTDTPDSLPSVGKLRVDKTRRPTPLMTSSALSDFTDSAVYSSPSTPMSAMEFPPSRSREPSYAPPRGVSPSRSATDPQHATTPPRTPRASLDFSSGISGDISSPISRTSSISGSRSGSRATSPSPRTPADATRLPKTDLDWNTLLAANTARKSNPPPRVSTLRQESMPTVGRLDTHPPLGPSRNSSLPYPVDDGPMTPIAWMPSEQQHQYFPEPRSNLPIPLAQEAKTLSRAASPAPAQAAPGPGRSLRPSFQPHRSSSVDLPKMEKPQQPQRPRANESKRLSSFNDPSQAKKDAQKLVEKALPKCSRLQPVAGYSDWYTMTGAPSLDFCPDCIDYLDRTVFRLSFRKSPPRSLDKKVTCALGGMPWVRLAWLLTLQRQRGDLNLLKDVAEIEDTTDPCPGDRHAVRAWYGLRDPDGLFVRDFSICYNDVKKIERLLPSLNGIFVQVPHRVSHNKQLCAIRPEGNRFSAYLDALVTTHEKALSSRRGVDPLPFIELVEKRQRLRECTKDSIILNQLWHYIPHVPELTVCEDCFETVVEPEVKKNKDLAMRFNRTVQPVYGETIGSSCQLYSQRMRRVFRRALQDNDANYLARKARERRDAELRLQDRYRDVMRKAKRLSLDNGGVQVQDEERRLDREIRRITDEWQTQWE